jgi:large subunit ribosomal protein L17
MSAHRKALHRSMVTSLFRYERIRTTKAKALAVRRSAERLITRAKADTVHNRRIVSARLFDEGIVAKLFTDIGPRMLERPGGYTRILKLGERAGDAAEIVILELVDYQLKEESAEDKKARKQEKKAAAKSKDKDDKKARAGRSGGKRADRDAGGKKEKAVEKAPEKAGIYRRGYVEGA